MSNSSPKPDASTPITTASLAAHAKTRLAEAYTTPWVVRSTQLILLVALFSGSAMAQTELGSLYCDTAVEDIINVVFTAFAGLGLPATMFFVSRSGSDTEIESTFQRPATPIGTPTAQRESCPRTLIEGCNTPDRSGWECAQRSEHTGPPRVARSAECSAPSPSQALVSRDSTDKRSDVCRWRRALRRTSQTLRS